MIAEYFDYLIERCNREPNLRLTNLPWNDQVIYLVISTRCEIDMNGFESVFDQLLSQEELRSLVHALNHVGAFELANSFDEAISRLKTKRFFENESLMVADLDKNHIGFLDDIEQSVLKNDSLWDLHNRLTELIPCSFKPENSG